MRLDNSSKLSSFRKQASVLRKGLWRKSAEDAGSALVEVAATLPVLLLVVTGIFSFGIYLNNNMELTNGVGTGARLLAISRGQTSDPCSTVSSAVYSAAPTLASGRMTFTFVLNGNSYTGASCASGSPTSGAAANLVQGQPAQVTVTYPCSLSVYGHNYSPGCTLTATTTELVQ